jgi:poly-gamma-glutamate synthesis protein (capsule biosynthesis protein)
MNLAAARQPALVERAGLRCGFLSYNCVGPRESWATPKKAGCAYVQVFTHYEVEYGTPGGSPKTYTFAEHVSVEAMQDDVARLRQTVDVVSVSFHKGIGHTPASVAAYERQVAKAAIDAGADIVVGHHAHILAGVETYKGKPIFHGLGNFVTVTRALSMEANASPERLEWARRRKKKFGFEPDPAYPTYPFHPEARNTIIASCRINEDGVIDAGFIPCYIEPNGAPEVLGHDARGVAVADYVEHITRESGLKAQFQWEGQRVRFH